MLSFKKILILMTLFFTLPSWANDVDFGSLRLNRIYQQLQKRQHFENPRKRILKVENRVYYLNGQGDLIETSLQALIDEFKYFGGPKNIAEPSARNNKGQNNNSPSQQVNDTDRQSSRAGKIDFGDPVLNKIYDQLIRNPQKIIADKKNGKAFWLGRDPQGRPAILEAPLFQLPQVVGAPKGPHIDWPGDGQTSPNFTPSLQPRDRICKNETGMHFTPRDHMISSSAQLNLNNRANCNGFRVSGNHILTNAHCMGSVANTKVCDRHLIKRMDYSGKVVSVEHTPRYRRCADRVLKKQKGRRLRGIYTAKFLINGRYKKVRCRSIKAISASLDYALLNCPGIPKEVPVAKMATKRPSPRHPLTLATWNFERGRVRSRTQTGRLLRGFGNQMAASTKVIAGNSGSVMYNDQMEAVGLANSSVWDVSRRGRNGNERTGFYAISDIMRDIKQQASREHSLIRSASRGTQVSCQENSFADNGDPTTIDY